MRELHVGRLVGFRELHLGDDLVRLQRGLEQALEEFVGGDPPLVGDDGGAEAQRGRRVVGIGIVVGERAADRAAMAHRRIADHAGKLRQRRQRSPARPASSRPRRACVMAPMVSERPFISMPVKPSTFGRSTMLLRPGEPKLHRRDERVPAGEELGFLLLGQQVGRLPDRSRAVVFECVHLTSPIPLLRASVAAFLQRRPHRLRGRRHGEILAADRVGDGVDDRRRRRDRAGLAAALDAERIATGIGRGRVDLERRQVVGARHAVVHERAGHELAVLVVDRALQQRLADALGDAAVDLALDDHRIDRRCRNHRPRSRPTISRLAGVRIDLDLADVAAGREGEVGRVVERALLQARLELLRR